MKLDKNRGKWKKIRFSELQKLVNPAGKLRISQKFTKTFFTSHPVTVIKISSTSLESHETNCPLFLDSSAANEMKRTTG